MNIKAICGAKCTVAHPTKIVGPHEIDQVNKNE